MLVPCRGFIPLTDSPGFPPEEYEGWCQWCGPPHARIGRCTVEPEVCSPLEVPPTMTRDGIAAHIRRTGEAVKAASFPDLRTRYLDWIRANRSAHSDPHLNHASQLGEPCERRIYLDRTGADRKPIDDELASIFQYGQDHEELAAVNYRRMGYAVELSQQRFRVEDTENPGEVLWTGRTDGVLVDRVTGDRVAFDGKTVRDALRLSDRFRAKYETQMRLYLSAQELERGMVILWDKGTGIPEQMNVTHDAGELARIHDKARRLNRAVREEDPPPFTSDLSLCDSCPFNGKSCSPSVEVEPTGIIADADISAKLAEAVELEGAGKRHKRLSDKLKARLKGNAKGMEPGDTKRLVTPEGIQVTIKKTAAQVRIAWAREDTE